MIVPRIMKFAAARNVGARMVVLRGVGVKLSGVQNK